MPTREENRRFWGEQYDWSDLGESWTPDPVWKRTILEATLWRYLERERDVLEIGPGAGRWTAEILALEPRRLVLVDLAAKCLDLCRARFGAQHPDIEYVLGDGLSLAGIADRQIDLIWSFDVFVHVEKPEVRGYVREFARVLRPGGLAIVHYASIDRCSGPEPRAGWRADFTSADMAEVAADAGLSIEADLYDPHISHANSSIAVLRRP
jgi:SAM-dependent methyltransferase